MAARKIWLPKIRKGNRERNEKEGGKRKAGKEKKDGGMGEKEIKWILSTFMESLN